MPTSVRLDPKTERLLEKLASERAQSKSDVIRDAIESLATTKSADVDGGTLYESIYDLVGCAEGGLPDLSERTGKRFRELLTGRSPNE